MEGRPRGSENVCALACDQVELMALSPNVLAAQIGFPSMPMIAWK